MVSFRLRRFCGFSFHRCYLRWSPKHSHAHGIENTHFYACEHGYINCDCYAYFDVYPNRNLYAHPDAHHDLHPNRHIYAHPDANLDVYPNPDFHANCNIHQYTFSHAHPITAAGHRPGGLRPVGGSRLVQGK